MRHQMMKICELRNLEHTKITYNAGSIESLINITESSGGMTIIPELATWNLTPEVLAEISAKVCLDYPNVVLAGVYSPPFKPSFSSQDLDRMISEINLARPDVLWVGMTAPKQEKWIFDNRNRVTVGFAGAIGAVFDFCAGRVRRSHPFFQACGLEWLPRLLQQPRRLWRRTFVSAPVFLFHVIRSKFNI